MHFNIPHSLNPILNINIFYCSVQIFHNGVKALDKAGKNFRHVFSVIAHNLTRSGFFMSIYSIWSLSSFTMLSFFCAYSSI